jgi:hypothetical protein
MCLGESSFPEKLGSAGIRRRGYCYWMNFKTGG